MAFFVYLVKCADSTYYCGYTKDLDRRIKEHNQSGKGARYTRARRPVGLCYSEEFQTLSEALKREYQIKKLSKIEKLNLISSKNTK